MLADDAAHARSHSFQAHVKYLLSPRCAHVRVLIHSQKLEQVSLICLPESFVYLSYCNPFLASVSSPAFCICPKIVDMTSSSEEPRRGSPEVDLEKAGPTTTVNNEAVEDEYPGWQKVR
jgi:hypothetical protein